MAPNQSKHAHLLIDASTATSAGAIRRGLCTYLYDNIFLGRKSVAVIMLGCVCFLGVMLLGLFPYCKHMPIMSSSVELDLCRVAC